jgi:hypothetical protein
VVCRVLVPLCESLPNLKSIHIQYCDRGFDSYYSLDKGLMEAMRAARPGLEITDGDYC